MNREALREQLIRHEGLRLLPYKCSAGKLTIGVGRNIEDGGISEAEALYLLDNDIATVERELSRFGWYRQLDDARQTVVANMAFNMGIVRLLGFKNTIDALEAGDYERAAAEMISSKWAYQVGKRALELSDIMRSGRL